MILQPLVVKGCKKKIFFQCMKTYEKNDEPISLTIQTPFSQPKLIFATIISFGYAHSALDFTQLPSK